MLPPGPGAQREAQGGPGGPGLQAARRGGAPLHQKRCLWRTSGLRTRQGTVLPPGGLRLSRGPTSNTQSSEPFPSHPCHSRRPSRAHGRPGQGDRKAGAREARSPRYKARVTACPAVWGEKDGGQGTEQSPFSPMGAQVPGESLRVGRKGPRLTAASGPQRPRCRCRTCGLRGDCTEHPAGPWASRVGVCGPLYAGDRARGPSVSPELLQAVFC